MPAHAPVVGPIERVQVLTQEGKAMVAGAVAAAVGVLFAPAFGAPTR